MDLLTIFTAFSQSGELTKAQSNYQFGTIIMHEGSFCYKIELKGKVTAYLVIIDKKTKRELVYESKLTLAKKR